MSETVIIIGVILVVILIAVAIKQSGSQKKTNTWEPTTLSAVQQADLDSIRGEGARIDREFEETMAWANQMIDQGKKPESLATTVVSDDTADEADYYTSPYKDAASFYIAGVTFNNDDGSSRQDTLKLIAESKSGKAKVKFVIGEYEGKPTIQVFAKGKQIGHAPAEEVDAIIEFLSGGEYSARVSAFGGKDGKPYTGKVEYYHPEDEVE